VTWLQRKLLLAVLTVWVAMTLTFLLVHQMPGDPIHTWAVWIQKQTPGIQYEDARAVAKTMLNYDPNEPLLTQYARYMGNLLRGNLGYSLTYRIKVNTIIASALPWTMFITTAALVLSFGIGTLLGLFIAWRRKTILDPLLTLYATVTQAVPDFLIGLLLLIVFGLALRCFPLRGPFGASTVPGFNVSFLADVAWHAVLPIMSFALPAIGGWVLTMKASALSVLSEDYIQVARAKGLTERRIVLQYLGRNAVLPLITTLAASMGSMLGASMFVETIYGYPGIGYFTNYAIATRDYTLMQGLFLLTTVAAVIANLAADLIAPRLDPRLEQS
jgi:peptide/nickel transport system permease protein